MSGVVTVEIAGQRYPIRSGLDPTYVGELAAYVDKKADLPAAIEEMIAYDGPYVLDVAAPYQEHVLPMIPGGKTVRDLIKE